MYSLYLLTDPTGAETAYIGKTRISSDWLGQHLNDISGNPNNRHCRWLKMLKVRGLKPIMTVLDIVLDADISQAERDAISMCQAIRGTHCVNDNRAS